MLCFSGCGVEPTEGGDGKYELKTVGNEAYLVIDKDAIENIASTIDIDATYDAEIRFDSIEEFIDTVKNGKLNDTQLAIANKTFENELVTTTKVLENASETEYYYSTAEGDFKKIGYTLTNEETTLTVDETYRLSMKDETIKVSQDIPYRVTIYGVKSGVYFSTEVFDIEERPTAEWIGQFGVKAYN